MSSTANAIADAFLGVLNALSPIITGATEVITFMALTYLMTMVIARMLGGLFV